MIAVRKNYRKLGLGRKIYEHFIKCAREKRCLKMKAITKPINLDSIAFHKRIGMELTGNGMIDDYLLFTIMQGLENIESFS